MRGGRSVCSPKQKTANPVHVAVTEGPETIKAGRRAGGFACPGSYSFGVWNKTAEPTFESGKAVRAIAQATVQIEKNKLGRAVTMLRQRRCST
jgi:hypothetical protein